MTPCTEWMSSTLQCSLIWMPFCAGRALCCCTPQQPLSCLRFLLEGTSNQVLLGKQERGVGAPRPQQAVRRAVPHRRPAVRQPLPAALALDLRGAHRPPRPQDLPPPGWEHGPAHRVQGARQLLGYRLTAGWAGHRAGGGTEGRQES